MNKHRTAPYMLYSSQKNKDASALTELQTIFQYLTENVATTKMVSASTSIPLKNICRYKKDLENRGLLHETEKKPCAITGYKAWYFTANKDLATKI